MSFTVQSIFINVTRNTVDARDKWQIFGSGGFSRRMDSISWKWLENYLKYWNANAVLRYGGASYIDGHTELIRFKTDPFGSAKNSSISMKMKLKSPELYEILPIDRYSCKYFNPDGNSFAGHVKMQKSNFCDK